jgi:hypothetical protein
MSAREPATFLAISGGDDTNTPPGIALVVFDQGAEAAMSWRRPQSVRIRWKLALGSLAGAALAVWASAVQTELGIPAELAGFRSWDRVTAEPKTVPYEQAVLCVATPLPPKFADRAYPAIPRARHGPHNAYSIVVYANPAALAALKDPASKAFPPGAVIAKEKLDRSATEGIAFMLKHKPGEFSESGGWEFSYFPGGPDKPRYDSCIACHRSDAARDFVFERLEHFNPE